MIRIASMAMDGVSFCGRGGTRRGFGGGVEERLGMSLRVARGNTAARGAELGEDLGGGSTLPVFVGLEDVRLLGVSVVATLAVGLLAMAWGKLPSAKAAVAFDIQG